MYLYSQGILNHFWSLKTLKVYLRKNLMNKFVVAAICLLTGMVSYAQVDTTQTPGGDSVHSDSTDVNNNFNLPAFSTTSDDMGDNIQSQDINSLLSASRDVFMQAASTHYITARFRYRGYAADMMTVMMNGVRINNLETGIAGWSTWGGMNDVIRFMEMKTGLGLSRSTFGDIGGYFNLNVYASSYRKGLRVSYSRGNRIFKDRVTATYSTGLMKNGWAFTASGTARYANEGYSPGTFFEGYGVYFAADKQINLKHTLSFIGFGAPVKTGRASMNTEEAFTLKDDHYYNSFWGFQTDSVTGSIRARNAKVSTTNKPSFLLSHAWNIDQNSKLVTSFNYTFGRNSLTGINWFDDKNPQPDYYQYLPSYYGPTSTYPSAYWYDKLKYNWEKGVGTTGQVDWNGFYNANYKNLYTIQNANGIAGNNVTGLRSKYIL